MVKTFQIEEIIDSPSKVAGLPFDGAEEKSKQLRKVIARKNLVQYECRSVQKSDADEMVKVTTRIYQWVRETLHRPTNPNNL